MRHRPDGTAHQAMAWAARRAQTGAGAGAVARRGAVAVVMTYMLALDPAATPRPLRRTVSAPRMRAHPLREDLRRAQSPDVTGAYHVRNSEKLSRAARETAVSR
ncbi:hypothetical protein SVIOM74S_06152 [Streptomyces violarus]